MQLQALWAAGNLAGARATASGPQELANDVIEAGAARCGAVRCSYCICV